MAVLKRELIRLRKRDFISQCLTKRESEQLFGASKHKGWGMSSQLLTRKATPLRGEHSTL